MDPEQREILVRNRVQLVENINVQDGLYTQLLSKNVFNNRTINRIKLNRTPEQQVEELLNELPKRECFSAFCAALDADEQGHIVRKYLKPEKSQTAPSGNTGPLPSTSATTVSNHSDETTASQQAETTDSTSLKRPNSSAVCFRETDNKHVYITYSADDASPAKCRKENENAIEVFEPDETRYVTKHFVADPSSSLHIVKPSALCHKSLLDNPQSVLHNPYINDPSRYEAAFNPQMSSRLERTTTLPVVNDARAGIPPPMSSPLKEPSSRINEQHGINLSKETAHIRNLLRPNPTNTHPSLLNLTKLCAGEQGAFIRLSTAMSPSKDVGSQFSSPQQYLRQTGVLAPSKGSAPMMSTSPPVRDVGFVKASPSSESDSVDTITMNGPVISVNKRLSDASYNSQPTEFSELSAMISAAPAEAISSLQPTPSLYPSNTALKLQHSMSNEMEEIDLPDGCVNVKVEHCSRDFFLANHKRSYPMGCIPRGLALIINVDEVEGKPARKGTNFDRDNMCNLLSQLHFNIIVYNDKDGLSAQEMVRKLQDFAKRREHRYYDACFICLLSHGEEEYIFGTDGKRIPLNEIFMLFDNTHCKGLIGKPKIFIIQACRGGTLDKGVRMDEPDGGSVPSKSHCQLPSMSDMLICYPTLAGYYAWRNRARGSWYIEAIVQIFMRYAKNEDICAMLNRVNQLVSRKVSECNQKDMNQMSQMSEYKSTLRQPYLFFFPGIEIPRNTFKP